MKKKILSVISFLLICTTLFSAAAIARIYYQRAMDKKGFEDLYNVISMPSKETTPITDADSEKPPADETTAEEKKTVPFQERNLSPLFEMNADCVGWIYIPDTTVNYPFMHTPEESQKYLRKNFDGSYSISGIPFLQSDCTLEGDNLIIYGHNMKNGTMFSDITGYTDYDYCLENPTIEIETSDGVFHYTVYTAAQVKSNHPWYTFTKTESEQGFKEKLAILSDSFLYTTDATPEYGRQLLTLSTCHGPSQDDRLIVIAVLENQNHRFNRWFAPPLKGDKYWPYP